MEIAGEAASTPVWI